ncbi:MAG: photosynthetic complex putative assembly protein PuhB, partial [Pseudomonadota bacterium]
ALAFNAFRLRWVLGYFIAMTVFRIANLSSNAASSAQMTDVLMSSTLFCAAAFGLILALSFAMSRAALFTITNKRVVMRYGAAIRKYVNVPFSKMAGAQLIRKSARVGDISVQLDEDRGRPPYLHLWPFVRPFKYSKPQPMMRGIEDVEKVASILARAVFEEAPDKVQMELELSDPIQTPGAGSKASIPAT